jgi:hypothetical protein
MAAEPVNAGGFSNRNETFGSRADLWLAALLLGAFGGVFYEALVGPDRLVMGLAAAAVPVPVHRAQPLHTA